MTLEQRTHKLIEALLVAQISNVEPDDAETILNRWAFLISTALKQAQDDVRKGTEHETDSGSTV